MDNNSFNFTKEAIGKILPPKKDRVIYKDTKEYGLILITSYTGTKSFYIAQNIKTKIGKKYYRKKIGNFSDLSISEARNYVSELKAKIGKGGNPFEKEVKLPKDLTFKELFNKYEEDYGKHNIKEWKYIINSMNLRAKHLYDKKILAIQRDDIQIVFNNITNEGTKIAANKFVVRMCAIFNKAIEWGLLDKNPTRGIKKHKEKARDRYITAEEKAKFIQAVKEESNTTMRDFIFIALYTGARKGNVLSMRWKDISFERKTWYISDTKNGDPQFVVLGGEALNILQKRATLAKNDWVFPSDSSASGHLQEPKKAWRKICQRAELEDLRIHDLRRTRGSWMAIAGASQYVIGKALNHKSPSSTAIYARLSLDPVREYIEKADRLFSKV
jgi:integrase